MELKVNSVKRIRVRNLLALREFKFNLLGNAINSRVLDKFFYNSPNIECLNLVGDFSYLNFDNLVRLKTLILNGKIKKIKKFNFNLFKKLCSQLTYLDISLDQIDDSNIEKLFYGRHFPNLTDLRLKSTKITKLEKKLFDGLSNLVSLQLPFNKLLKSVDHDAFSNLKQLRNLDLSFNCIDSLEKEHFSELVNLETLQLNRNGIKTINNNMFSDLNKLNNIDLSYNKIENVNQKSFAGLQNLKIDLAGNRINNKDELSSHFKDSKIKFSI